MSKRSPWFWVAIVGGAVVGLCALCSAGTLVFGLLAPSEAGSSSPGGATAGEPGAQWLPVSVSAEGTGLQTSLEGGRWVYQSGAAVDQVVARSGDTAWVKTSSSGAVHSLSFDGSSYEWRWVNQTVLGSVTSRSEVIERGDFALEGGALTLTPSSQRATYSANEQTQTKEDVDLAPRRYQLVDAQLTTVEHTGAPQRAFGGLVLRGPHPSWDFSSGAMTVPLQRL
jgi:hypothetical protein